MSNVQDNSSSNVKGVNLYKQCVDDLSFLSSQEGCGIHYAPWMFKSVRLSLFRRLETFRSHWAIPEQEGCHVIAGCAPRFPLQITSWSPTLGAKVFHQYFLISIVLLNALQLVTGATGLWSQGATAVNHGCSVHALGSGYGETTLLVSLHSSAALWNWVPSGVLPRKRHKLVALNVIFIKKQQPAGGGVSQQHSDKQHTNPSFGSLTHWIWLHT